MSDLLQKNYMTKKLKNYYQINIILILLTAIFYCSIFINEVIAQNINFKEQSDEITKLLRCMTCQNLTIYESDTDFANQIKKEVLEQLKNNQTKTEIIDFMVERYGNYILLKPKFNISNLLLWVLPFALFVCILAVLFYKSRKF